MNRYDVSVVFGQVSSPGKLRQRNFFLLYNLITPPDDHANPAEFFANVGLPFKAKLHQIPHHMMMCTVCDTTFVVVIREIDSMEYVILSGAVNAKTGTFLKVIEAVMGGNTDNIPKFTLQEILIMAEL